MEKSRACYAAQIDLCKGRSTARAASGEAGLPACEHFILHAWKRRFISLIFLMKMQLGDFHLRDSAARRHATSGWAGGLPAAPGASDASALRAPRSRCRSAERPGDQGAGGDPTTFPSRHTFNNNSFLEKQIKIFRTLPKVLEALCLATDSCPNPVHGLVPSVAQMLDPSLLVEYKCFRSIKTALARSIFRRKG